MTLAIQQIDTNCLMNENEAAKLLCYSVRALQNWRYRGGGPKFIKVSSRSVRYSYGDVMDWIDSRRIANTSEPIR
jgi:predicted DNA-binding transcriptional regulator AlpA